MAISRSTYLKAVLRGLAVTRTDHLASRAMRGRGVILMLHHVLPEEPEAFSPNRILQVTPKFLEAAILEVRAQGYDIVSLDEACRRMSTTVAEDRPFACFTFDDGYRDNARNAFPVFARHQAPMAIYVTPGLVDRTAKLWWLTFEEIIRRAESIEAPLPGGRTVFRCRTVAEKELAFDAVYWWLRSLPDREIHAYVDERAKMHDIDPGATCDELVMTWPELRELARDPLVTIGAHTMSHAALAKLPADEARVEMHESVERISRELERPCVHFAYPYGDAGSAGPREYAIARELGLNSAVTTRKGMIAAAGRPSMTGLPRLSLNGDYQDVALLRVLLSGLPFAMLNMAGAARRRLARWRTAAALNPVSASTR